MPHSPRVLIVGGGIGGGTLAIALARRGMQPHIVEIEPEWGPVGVGLTLLGPALRALATIGLIDQAVASGNGIYRFAIGNADSEITHVSDMPRLNGPDYPSAVQIARPAFHNILAEEITSLGIPVTTGCTVASIANQHDHVEVELTNGTSGQYDVVVGADGVHSYIRELVFGREPAPRVTGQAVWRAMAPRPRNTGPEYKPGVLYMFYGPRNKAGMLAVSTDEIYVFLVQNVPTKVRPPQTQLPALMRQQLSDYTGLLGELRDRILNPEQVVYRPLEVLLVPSPWYRGRVVLIGDAAHTTTPHLAHGGGLAIEDAIVLAELIETQAPVEAALEQFMDRRWERCRMVVANSIQLGEWEKQPSADADPAGLTTTSWAKLAEPI
jgi:2-polyprenyl-6-methoxyphenol hydroxylase-like FAD-dependent oxidoreductase